MHYNVAPRLAKDSIEFDSYQKINVGLHSHSFHTIVYLTNFWKFPEIKILKVTNS